MTPFKTVYDRVEKHIEERYRLPVSITDVLDPNTGDFDGMRIQLDHDLDLELAVFVLLHLFGHTVQWNVSPELRALGLDTTPGKSDAELARIFAYERDATRYSVQLLHEVEVFDRDRWLTRWWKADWRFLERFYRTGERLDPRDFLATQEEEEPLAPLPIPRFEPQRWISRWSF